MELVNRFQPRIVFITKGKNCAMITDKMSEFVLSIDLILEKETQQKLNIFVFYYQHSSFLFLCWSNLEACIPELNLNCINKIKIKHSQAFPTKLGLKYLLHQLHLQKALEQFDKKKQGQQMSLIWHTFFAQLELFSERETDIELTQFSLHDFLEKISEKRHSNTKLINDSCQLVSQFNKNMSNIQFLITYFFVFFLLFFYAYRVSNSFSRAHETRRST